MPSPDTRQLPVSFPKTSLTGDPKGLATTVAAQTTSIRAPSTTWSHHSHLRSERNPIALRRVRTRIRLERTHHSRGSDPPETHQLDGAADKEHDVDRTAITPHLNSLRLLRGDMDECVL